MHSHREKFVVSDFDVVDDFVVVFYVVDVFAAAATAAAVCVLLLVVAAVCSCVCVAVVCCYCCVLMLMLLLLLLVRCVDVVMSDFHAVDFCCLLFVGVDDIAIDTSSVTPGYCLAVVNDFAVVDLCCVLFFCLLLLLHTSRVLMLMSQVQRSFAQRAFAQIVRQHNTKHTKGQI